MTSIVVPANGSAAAPAAAPAFSGRTLTFVKNLWVTVANQANSSALSAWQYAQTRAEEALEQALPVVQAKANEALDFLARSCGKRRRNDDLADAVLDVEQGQGSKKAAKAAADIEPEKQSVEPEKQSVEQGQGSKDAEQQVAVVRSARRQEQEVAAIEDFDLGIRIQQEVAALKRKAAAKREAAAMEHILENVGPSFDFRQLPHVVVQCSSTGTVIRALRYAVPLPADQIQADLALMRAAEKQYDKAPHCRMFVP